MCTRNIIKEEGNCYKAFIKLFKIQQLSSKRNMKFNLENYPSFLKNKIKIMIQCLKKLEINNWEKIKEDFLNVNFEENEISEKIKSKKLNKKFVYIENIIFGENFSIILLSNNNFQMIFDDLFEIYYCKDNKTIHIHKDQHFQTFYALNDFVMIDNIDLWKRISFVNQIIKNFQIINFKNHFLENNHTSVLNI